MNTKRDMLRRAVHALCDHGIDSGVCVYCNATHDNTEPDLHKGYCDSCGKFGVYGVETLLIEAGAA